VGESGFRESERLGSAMGPRGTPSKKVRRIFALTTGLNCSCAVRVVSMLEKLGFQQLIEEIEGPIDPKAAVA